MLGPLAAPERAARDGASPPAPSRRAPGSRAPECGAASPRRRQKNPNAGRGKTGDKEAPGRDEESLIGGGGERTLGPPAAAAGSGRAAHAGSPSGWLRSGEGAPAAPRTGQRLVPWRARARDPPAARRRRAALPRAVSPEGRRRRRSIFCPCTPASVEEVPEEDRSPCERRRKDQRLLIHQMRRIEAA